MFVFSSFIAYFIYRLVKYIDRRFRSLFTAQTCPKRISVSDTDTVHTCQLGGTYLFLLLGLLGGNILGLLSLLLDFLNLLGSLNTINGEELSLEDESGATGDGANATLAVAKLRGNGQGAAAPLATS